MQQRRHASKDTKTNWPQQQKKLTLPTRQNYLVIKEIEQENIILIILYYKCLTAKLHHNVS